MKKKVFIVFALLTACAVFALNSCGAEKPDVNKITVVGSESWFSDYSVDGEIVTIKCRITLKNENDTTADFEIFGDFSADKGTLLTDGVLKGTDMGTNVSRFRLKPDEEKAFDVVFNGTFAGTDRKNDRLTPDIRIKIVDDK